MLGGLARAALQRSSSGFVPLRRGFAETATEYLTKHHQQAPELGFAYDALEPVFSATSMFNHHRRHCDHVKELNRAISAFAVANEKGNLDGVIASQVTSACCARTPRGLPSR